MHPLVKEYKEKCKKLANIKDAIPMRNYMKSEMPFYGIKTPARKKIYSKLHNKYPLKTFDEWYQVIDELWNAQYREERYAALDTLGRYRVYHTLRIIPLIEHLVVTGAWWDYVDWIASRVVGDLFMNYPTEMKKTLKSWNQSKNMWLRRTSIIAQLRFKEKTDEELLYSFIRNTSHEEEFFIQKSIGWALREYAKTNPESVRKFINSNELSKLSKREGGKYIDL
jgi:3-methyladenine DNA glycosylase AlkD